MKVNVNDRSFEFILEGPISEKTEIFEYDIRIAHEIKVDMEKVTFINSIGVKNWLQWAARIPNRATVTLYKCPFVIINQINMVQGFLPTGGRVQSFYAPYISNSGTEMTVLFERGREYDYAENGKPERIAFPETLVHPKNQEAMEPDFVISKVAQFLKKS